MKTLQNNLYKFLYIYKDLILELVKRDLKERFLGSVLGIFWIFIWPFINLLIYTLIFSKVMGAKLVYVKLPFSYGFYLASGFIPWTTFSIIVSRLTNIFIEKKFIIGKIGIPLQIFPAVIVCSESINFLISWTIFSFFLLIIAPSHFFSKEIFLVIPSYIFLIIFATGIGIFFASLNVFLRDIKEIVGILLQIWFWFTPIVYVPEILPEFAKKLLFFNPVWPFIEVFQNVTVTKQSVNLLYFFLMGLIAVFLFFLSFKFLQKLEKDIRDFL